MNVRGLLWYATAGALVLTSTVLAHAGWWSERQGVAHERATTLRLTTTPERLTTVAADRYRQMPPRHWRMLLINK